MSVPHLHVPILAKHANRKVFDDTLSAAHVSGNKHITLINPLEIDLLSYKEKLDQYFTK